MEYLQKMVEERIQKAQEEGAFNNLAGKGKPLNLDDETWIPEDLRLTFKILKNSNCLPVELEMRREIFSLHQLIAAATDPDTRTTLRRRLNVLVLNLNVRRRGAATIDLPQSTF